MFSNTPENPSETKPSDLSFFPVKTEAKQSAEDFVQYASCPDSQKTFAAISANNQTLWIKRSEEVINEFSSKLDSFKDFYSLFSFLAQKRHEIAEELGHRKDEGRMRHYGTFRTQEDAITFEGMVAADVKQSWSGQKDKCFELMDELVKNIEMKESTKKQEFYYKDEFLHCSKSTEVSENSPKKVGGVGIEHGVNTFFEYILGPKRNESSVYTITIHSPHKEQEVEGSNHSMHLATLFFHDFSTDKKRNKLNIRYAPINKYNRIGDFKLANQYFQAMQQCEANSDSENYLKALGRLVHLLAHILPVMLGTAGIVEWIMRGCTFKKGWQLGQFNHDEKISWDFKALLTPNREDYANWFAKSAFQQCIKLTDDECAKKFSFMSATELNTRLSTKRNSLKT